MIYLGEKVPATSLPPSKPALIVHTGIKECSKCGHKSMVVALESSGTKEREEFREVWKCNHVINSSTGERCNYTEPLKAWITPKFELMRR